MEHEATRAIKRSDILAVSLAFLGIGMTFLLGPEWGWPFLLAGLGGMVVYFALWRSQNPSWLNPALLGILTIFVLSSGSVLAWKLVRIPRIATRSIPPSVPSAQELNAAYNKALREIRHLRSATESRSKTGLVSSQSGTAVGTVTVQPGAVVSFGQQGGQTGGVIINNAPLERHLTTSQKENLDAIARDLPDSAVDWLTVEHANDAESGQLAKEIFSELSSTKKVKNFVTRLAEPDPELRGVFVNVASQEDENFKYAERIANAIHSPTIGVWFGPPTDPKPRLVYVRVMSAPPMQPIVRTLDTQAK